MAVAGKQELDADSTALDQVPKVKAEHLLYQNAAKKISGLWLQNPQYNWKCLTLRVSDHKAMTTILLCCSLRNPIQQGDKRLPATPNPKATSSDFLMTASKKQQIPSTMMLASAQQRPVLGSWIRGSGVRTTLPIAAECPRWKSETSPVMGTRSPLKLL